MHVKNITGRSLLGAVHEKPAKAEDRGAEGPDVGASDLAIGFGGGVLAGADEVALFIVEVGFFISRGAALGEVNRLIDGLGDRGLTKSARTISGYSECSELRRKMLSGLTSRWTICGHTSGTMTSVPSANIPWWMYTKALVIDSRTCQMKGSGI